MQKQDRKNMIFFGLGTIGRDMFYALISNALIYYLSNILNLPLHIYIATSIVFTVLRVIDALNDPIMGLLIDNARWGKGRSKFKPPMLIGAIVSAVAYMFIFTDFGLRDYRFVIIFAIAYLIWDIFYGLNDIAYWSMLPALSTNQKVREKIGAFARICANVGMFIVMVGWQPVTEALGGDSRAWFIVALIVSIAIIAFQLFTIFGVKERQVATLDAEKTSFKDLLYILKNNDQLFWTMIAMCLFSIGYVTTTAMSIYYVEYVYGDANTYPILALVVGLSQIFALSIFPLLSKRLNRKSMFRLSIILMTIGYVLFFFADVSLVLIIVAALLLFVGEAFTQLLMLMLLSDTVEYGQWKLGRRPVS